MAGTISSSGMSDEAQGQIGASREAYEREQKEKERVAREELARESEERRTAREEKERQLKQQEERARREKEERESRERQQREQMERVERQAKELEERLARLVTSIPPPQVNVIDPEATQVHQGVRSATAGDNSFPGVTPGLRSSPRLEVAIPAKPKSKSLLMIGAGALVLLLAASIAGYFLLRSRTNSTGAGTGGTGTDLTNQGKSGGNQTVKADMVAIPGGTFQMGRNDGPPQERPAHAVTVQNFYMDRTEVTNGEYADFVAAANYEAPKDWVKGKPLPGQERWPVVNVSSQDAQAFAAWRSSRDGVTYRLPTEEEWEFAARSGDQQAYPWGNTWQSNRAVVKEAAPRPVGSLPDGKNRWGVVDLIGNVWEWTSSQASIYGGVAEIPANTKNWVVARGGSYASDPADRQIPISATYRDWYDPTLRHANFGFRLVRSGQ